MKIKPFANPIPRHAVVLIANQPAIGEHVARHLLRADPKRPLALVGAVAHTDKFRALTRQLNQNGSRVHFYSDETAQPHRISPLLDAVAKHLGAPLAVIELSHQDVSGEEVVHVKNEFNPHLQAALMKYGKNFAFIRAFKFIWVDKVQESECFEFNGGLITQYFQAKSFHVSGSPGAVRDMQLKSQSPVLRPGFDLSTFKSLGRLADWAVTAGPSAFGGLMVYVSHGISESTLRTMIIHREPK